MEPKIEWVNELPPTHTGRDDAFDKVVRELKTRPGKWARVGEPVTHASSVKPWIKRGCDSVARVKPRDGGGRRAFDIYARWPEPEKHQTMRGRTKESAVDPDLGVVADHGVPVRGIAREETEAALAEPEDVGDDSVRGLIAEARVPLESWETPTEKLNRERAASLGPLQAVSDVEPDVPPVVPTAPRQASDRELQVRSAGLAAGKLGKPERRDGETGPAYELRVARWKRGVPDQGKSAATMRTR